MTDSKARPRPAASVPPSLAAMAAEIEASMLGAIPLWSADSGCPAGRLTSLALELFSECAVSDDALPDLYDVECMLIGARLISKNSGINGPRDQAGFILLDGIYEKFAEYLGALDALAAVDKSEQALAAPEVDAGDDDFMAGIRLARDLLSDAKQREKASPLIGGSDAKRHHRGGAALDAFALPYLQHVQQHDTLMQGFAAGLSCGLFAGVCLDPAELDLPIAEFNAGANGADGTEPGENGAAWVTDQTEVATKIPPKPAGQRRRKAVAA